MQMGKTGCPSVDLACGPSSHHEALDLQVSNWNVTCNAPFVEITGAPRLIIFPFLMRA